MALTSKITDYNPDWPRQFEDEIDRLREIFGPHAVSFQHVGSTAVEGLAAKPEIDLLVEVQRTDALDTWELELKAIGYRRGGDLSEGHHFFKRDLFGVRTHKLHLCRYGHPTAIRMIRIRDWLRVHPTDREAYQALKLRLEQNNALGISEYLAGKAPFLDALYLRILETPQSGYASEDDSQRD